jgi:hypothetical protein
MFITTAGGGMLASTVLGGILGGSSSGGGSQNQTVNKDPWAPAQPWLQANLASGQNLQNQYAANPFSAYQQNAYTNSANGSNYARSIIAGLIPQLSQQGQYDPNNPGARPPSINFNAINAPASTGMATNGGNLGFSGGLAPSVNSAAAIQPMVAPAVPVASTGLAWNDPNRVGNGGLSYADAIKRNPHLG